MPQRTVSGFLRTVHRCLPRIQQHACPSLGLDFTGLHTLPTIASGDTDADLFTCLLTGRFEGILSTNG